MKALLATASISVSALLGAFVISASAMTFTTDKLSVSVSEQAVSGAEADYGGIWVGDVERNGKKVTWVELTDQYGEVVYEAEIRANETHLLPGGHALVVRGLEPVPTTKKQTAKLYTDRIAPDARRVATYRIKADPVEAPAKQSKRVSVEQDEGSAFGIVDATKRYISDAFRMIKVTVRGVRTAWM